MQRWHIKVVTNTAKAAVPGRQHVRQALRRLRPYTTNRGKDSDLFKATLDQIELLRDTGHDVIGKRILEIGSGWHPIAAMTFLAAGAASVTLTDVERLLDARLIRSAIEFVRERRDYMIEKIGRAGIERIDIKDGTVEEMLRRLGLTYLLPYRATMSPDGSADIIVSRTVFEHIPVVTLEAMLDEFRRILVPGGAMVHFIDPSDHYWQSDRSISRCNFLKYEDWQWRLLSLHPQAYHNRLRHSDFAAMFKRHGFKIIFEHRLTRESEQREIATMKLASRFAGYSTDDLAAIHSRFVAIAP